MTIHGQGCLRSLLCTDQRIPHQLRAGRSSRDSYLSRWPDPPDAQGDRLHARPSSRFSVGRARLAPISRVAGPYAGRSEEHTSELQSLMRISYAVFCLNKKTNNIIPQHNTAIYIQKLIN